MGDVVFIKQEGDKTKAKDKYLVTACNNTMLELRKFTSSQIRAKSYTVPKYDCVKVIPDPITKQSDPDAEITFPIGTHDELVEIPSSTVPDPKLDIRPPLPDAIAVPPIHTDLAPVPVGTDNEFVDIPSSMVPDPKTPNTPLPSYSTPHSLRQSNRTRRPPSWHKDYDMF